MLTAVVRDEVTWPELEALGHATTLSVLARWVEECTVKSAT